jgi:heat shock transcription factor
MQQRPLATRKRNPPGASAAPQQPQQQFNSNSNIPFQPIQDTSPPFDNQFSGWDGTAPQFADTSNYDPTIFDSGMNGSLDLDNGASLTQSSQLVRRNPNQQVATRPQPAWQDPGGGIPQQGEGVWPQMDEEDDLEQRALAAKKEAQAKRKQIPPFVQKLSR